MLSVVIPTYNINCSPLVNSLVKQLKASGDKHEIICIDDASTKRFKENKQLDNFNNVSFIRLDQNVGRSRIRNLLASTAKYKWLLFLDADTLPTHNNFIDKYLSIVKDSPKEQVIFGGLAYRKEDVINNNYLRYVYGNSRECISAKNRTKAPYKTLLMSNTCIMKEVFNKVNFNNDIRLYGHEDTLFSYNLANNSVLVKHINNPVFHTGLESNIVFINKSKTAIDNLWDLYLEGTIQPKNSKLLKWCIKARIFLIHLILSNLYKRFNKYLEKKLTKQNPSLFLFDLYKLGYLCSISKMKK